MLFGPDPVNIYACDGEQVIYHSRYHWCNPAINMLEMSVIMISVAVLSVLIDLLPFNMLWLQAIMWIGTIGHNCWMSRHLLRWRVDLIIMTNWRLIRTGGLLSIGRKSYRLDTIGNCQRLTSFWGRIFGFCTIRIVQNGGLHNVGASDEYLVRVPHRIADVIEHYANRPPTSVVIPHQDYVRGAA